MLVLVQWTTDPPTDWQELDHRDWPSLPDRPVHAVNMQGVIFEGYDHYGVTDQDGAVVVSVWDDDSRSSAMRWTFYDPAPDTRLDGAHNTRQAVEVFHDAHHLAGAHSSLGPVTVRRSWTEPPTVRHGLQVADDLHAQHRAVRAIRDWREWIVDDGDHLR